MIRARSSVDNRLTPSCPPSVLHRMRLSCGNRSRQCRTVKHPRDCRSYNSHMIDVDYFSAGAFYRDQPFKRPTPTLMQGAPTLIQGVLRMRKSYWRTHRGLRESTHASHDDHNKCSKFIQSHKEKDNQISDDVQEMGTWWRQSV